MYIFPRENSASGKPLVRLYTQINIHDGKKDKNPAYLARDSVKAADIMAADQRVCGVGSVHWLHDTNYLVDHCAVQARVRGR